MKRISIFGSYLFHPLWTATFFTTILFFGLSKSLYGLLFSPLQKGIICTGVCFYSAILPACVLKFAQKFNYIDTLELSNKRLRKTVFGILSLYYLIIAQFWNSWAYLHVITSLCYAIGIILLVIVVFLPKCSLSAHMAGMGLLGTALLLNLSGSSYLNAFWIVLCIVLSGAVGFFRLYLNAHTETELLTGYVTGIGSGLISFCYL